MSSMKKRPPAPSPLTSYFREGQIVQEGGEDYIKLTLERQGGVFSFEFAEKEAVTLRNSLNWLLDKLKLT
jgi:hypothetical protein